MEADIRGFVQACTVCARGKSSHQPPSGLLQPLSVPGRPWSHIALDFVTGLPPSNGKTVILTIVDRFSKAAHFVALAKLPTARETADLLANHVVRLHGIPWDIVSDRGPQFISQVWKSFCNGTGGVSESHLGVPSSIKRADGEDEPGPRVSATLCHGRQPEYLVTNHHCFHARNKSWPFPPSNIISNGVRRYGKGPRPPWRPPFSGIGDQQTSTDYLLPSTPKTPGSAAAASLAYLVFLLASSPPLQSSLQLSGAARLSAPAASAPRQAVTPTAGQTLICDFYSLKRTLKLLKLQSIWCLLWSAFRGLAPLCLGIVTLRSGQNMDPADQEPRSAPVQQAVTQQGILLGQQHDANIRALISANQTLAQQVASLSAQLASLQAPAAPTDQRNQPETGDDQQRDLQAVPPEPFSGVSSQCKGFIFQCKLFFQLKSISFSNDFSKIHFMLGLLQGKALTWAEARFAGRTFSGLTFSAFLEEFRRVFESPATPFCASSRLFTITQDLAPVAGLHPGVSGPWHGRGGLDRGRVVCQPLYNGPMGP
ncbi:hypothetical protein L3Q82_007123 [Scortum barcoo]|uniref:Uncharacterized protein n=1 Tax=Scortum barcoo TaxID=214431 RepID=A0ACB8WRZ0_9TELE|nr:hypothetical protein L3Q82_007123 [Scortum barcoo]